MYILSRMQWEANTTAESYKIKIVCIMHRRMHGYEMQLDSRNLKMSRN